jgi:shikimate dehydrogenase
MWEISGHTRIWGILADPIHHVKTPQALNALMRERGVDGVMVPMHVGPADLSSFVASIRLMRNVGGMIVTVPHKTAMLALCDEVSDSGRQSGAVNVIRRDAEGRLHGTMLDGEGFVGGLRAAGIEPAGKDTYLAGAGGAANAIAFALARAGVSRLTIANRSLPRAEDLRARVAAAYPALRLDVAIGAQVPEGHDLLVNATSLGLAPTDPLPFSVAKLGPDQVVAEIIMQPEVTTLLAAAAERGCRTHPGFPMLKSQLGMMADFLGMTNAAQ